MLQKLFNFKSILAFIAIIFIAVGISAAPKTPTTKTVLITGGAAGINKEITESFKKDGWHVWLATRDPSNYANLTDANVRKVDLSNQQQVHALVKEIRNKDGRLDVVVNNPGYGILGPQEAISATEAQTLFNINVIEPLIVIQESLPLLRASHDGHIINVSSISGLRAVPGLGMYAASKMALEGMSEALAAELVPWNIRVSIIEPGSVNNDWVQNAPQASNLDQYPGYKNFTNRLRKNLAQKSKEIGQSPQEIAQLILTVAKNPKPNLRYQTNSQAIGVANEVLTDPTGNEMRDKMALMAKDLYDLPG
jgi:NAD(P)-dependent dehydrogenase (short-subunit alcohol dehydrogenase family)